MDPPAVFKVLALGFTLLLIPSWEWLSKVSDRVPEPYLVSSNIAMEDRLSRRMRVENF